MTETLPDDAAGIARAAALLRAGGLVAFGTETVYGLGADARNDLAVAAIFDAKGRPHFNPLIIHLPDAEAAFAEVSPSGAARALAAAFWPGPLTMVLPRRASCRVGGCGCASVTARRASPRMARHGADKECCRSEHNRPACFTSVQRRSM